MLPLVFFLSWMLMYLDLTAGVRQKIAKVFALTTSYRSPKPTNCQPCPQPHPSNNPKSSQSRTRYEATLQTTTQTWLQPWAQAEPGQKQATSAPRLSQKHWASTGPQLPPLPNTTTTGHRIALLLMSWWDTSAFLSHSLLRETHAPG